MSKDNLGFGNSASRDIPPQEVSLSNPQDDRKGKRLDLIRAALIGCFSLTIIILSMIGLDLIFFEKDIYNATSIIIITSIIGGISTTLIGAVIGSSLD